MPVEVRIPEVGESIVEVQIAQWLKAEGDQVTKDESLAVIDSEKTTFDLPAPENGKLSRILCQAGQTVKVGASIAQIEPGSAAGPPRTAAAQSSTPPNKKPAPTAQPPPETQAPPPAATRVRALVPAAAASEGKPAKEPSEAEARSERAADKNVRAPAPPPPSRPKPAPAARVRQDGPSVETPSRAPARAAEPAREMASTPETTTAQTDTDTAPGNQPTQAVGGELEEEIVPMSMLRRTVARRLVEAQRTMVMLTTFNEVDMGAVQALRERHQEAFQKRYQIKLGLTSFFVKAAIAALKEFPQLNAEVRGDDIVYRNYFDIGVAIATPQGLVVPVLPHAEQLSFAEIETAVADFARRARERQLKPEELEGGTFTITNGGVFGSLLSTPIINPPQSGILGLHAVMERPVARDGQVVIRPMMYVALTYDHRIVDGREAVLFLRRIKEVVEDPARMLVEA
jgi:2-oxoglutarate dehydrogenase E2 component (dihydrolipoamide succinyltransferase)